jgi:hypothetical protein
MNTNMKTFALLAFFILCFMQTILTYGQDTSLKSAAEISQAEEILDNAFKAEIQVKTVQKTFQTDTGGLVTNTTIYTKLADDGVNLYRYEATVKRKKVGTSVPYLGKINIHNRTGTWEIIGSTALACKWEDEADKNILDAVNLNGKKIKCFLNVSCKEIEWKKQPCYLIRRQCTPEFIQQVQNLMANSTHSTALSNKDDLTKKQIKPFDAKKVIPAVYEYIIRKSDYAFLAQRTYNDQGDIVSNLEYDTVILGVPLDDVLFEVPKNLKIVQINTLQEYANFIQKNIQSNIRLK